MAAMVFIDTVIHSSNGMYFYSCKKGCDNKKEQWNEKLKEKKENKCKETMFLRGSNECLKKKIKSAKKMETMYVNL